MELTQLVETLKAFGTPGLFVVLIVLVGVFLARKSGLVATGNQARVANVILSAILFGLSGDPAAQTALESVIASVLAGLAYELLQKVPTLKAKG